MNGQPALTLGVSFAPKLMWWMGATINARLAELDAAPGRYAVAGVLRLRPPRCRPRCTSFVINFVASVAIVIVVLLIFMGLRSAATDPA